MADTFQWEIIDLRRYLNDGAVYAIDWKLHAKREVTEETIYESLVKGSTGLGEPNPSAFVPYDQITEEMAITWLEEAIGNDVIEQLKAGLTEKLDQQENPTTGSGIPWRPPYPTTGGKHEWDEESESWVKVSEKPPYPPFDGKAYRFDEATNTWIEAPATWDSVNNLWIFDS